jgi:uncharacterized protein (DUF849 family)
LTVDPITFSRRHLVIMAAPNGARRTRKDHAALPMTATQLAREASELVDARVSVLHLHVRDHDGGHTLDAGAYREAIGAIRKAVGDQLIIQVTSEAVGIYSPEQQMAMVRQLRPQAVSVALRELCPDETAEQQAARFYAFLQREHIWPQHILYSAEDVTRFEELRRRGLFAEQYPFCLLVLGNYASGREGEPGEFAALRRYGDFERVPWAGCCFGPGEQAAMLACVEQGGHVRLGFENNIHLAGGRLAANNAELVHSFLDVLPAKGRIPAGVEEIRQVFGIRPAGELV